MTTSEELSSLLFSLQSELEKQRVLIIDRHPPARDSLRLMLANIGITAVHGAGSSAEVIRQVRNNRFDIVLSDYILEDGRDGQQLLEELRYANLLPLSSVYIIVTSERSYHNVVSLAELTPDDYLVKPFTAGLLQNRLTRALYKKYILRIVYARMAKGAFAEAVEACDKVIEETPAYQLEASRFKGELLLAQGRLEEAEVLYEGILSLKPVPWAKMGLASVRRSQERLEDAEHLSMELVAENPEFLSAYDFLAAVQESRGNLVEAQGTLQEASLRSPHNTVRQRLVGEVALRNNDLGAAEKAFSKVLERHRGSSLRSVDDYTSLSKVQIEKGNLTGAREIIKGLRRDWRGEKQGELAALTMEGLAFQKEGQNEQAKKTTSQALALHQELVGEKGLDSLHSKSLTVDLAQICMVSGEMERAHELLRQVATEHHDDQRVISHVERVFEKTGQEDVGRALLEEVGAEIASLDNLEVTFEEGSNLGETVEKLMSAADRVPNVQFMINAAKAIVTLMDQRGWDADLATRASEYLQKARTKAPHNPRVLSALEHYGQVARKYGVSAFGI
ncbi:MAG: response regulator [Azovibrio sp.]